MSDDLLFTNTFHSTRVGGSKHLYNEYEKQSLLDYVDKIDKEEKQNSKYISEETSNDINEEKDRYRETVVNIDSRYRNIYQTNIKDDTIHSLQNTRYTSEVLTLSDINTVSNIASIELEQINGIKQLKISLTSLPYNVSLSSTTIKIFFSMIKLDNVNDSIYPFANNPYTIYKIDTTIIGSTTYYNLYINNLTNYEILDIVQSGFLEYKSVNFYIDLFTVNKNEDKLLITHPSHGFEDQDKISLDISWKQSLSSLGGYIYLTRMIKQVGDADPTILRIYYEGERAYMYKLLSENDRFTVYLELKNGSTITYTDLIILNDAHISTTTEEIKDDSINNDPNNIPDGNDISIGIPYFDIYSDLFNDFYFFDLQILDNGKFTITTEDIIQSRNNFWTRTYNYPNSNLITDLDLKKDKIDYSMWTIKDSYNIYIYQPFHGFKSPIGISGDIIAIKPPIEKSFTIDINDTNINDFSELWFEIDEKKLTLRENTYVYINIESSSDLKLNNNPYQIVQVFHKKYKDKYNRSEIFTTNYQQFKIKVNKTATVPDIIPLYEPNNNTETHDAIVLKKPNNNIPEYNYYQLDIEEANILTPKATFYTDDPSITQPDSTINQVKISNLTHYTTDILYVNLLRCYNTDGITDINFLKEQTHNYITSIEYVNPLLYDNGTLQPELLFKLTFQKPTDDSTFDIRNYVNKYILLNINTLLNSEFNQGPFEIVTKYKTENDIAIDLNTETTLIVKFSLDIEKIIIDHYGPNSVNNDYNHTDLISVTVPQQDPNDPPWMGWWQPADSTWLRITANKSDLIKIMKDGDQIKLLLNIEGFNDSRHYKVFNIQDAPCNPINGDTTYTRSQFDINTQIVDLTITAKANTNRTFSTIAPGGFNKYEIENYHPIYYLNDNIFYIKMTRKATSSRYFGGNSVLIEKLSIGNIPNKYIVADNPTNEDRINPFHKISYIDKDHYSISTNSPIVSTYSEYAVSKSINPTNYLNSKIINVTIQKILNVLPGYTYANHYMYEFGRTFEQISKIELVSTEFPNAMQVIRNFPTNIKNNKIYWRILDDGDYIYSTEISPGNYSAETLKIELQNKMNQVTRSFDNELYQEVIISIDTAKSLIEFRIYHKDIFTNNLSIMTGTSRLEVDYKKPHNFKTGDIVILTNVASIGNINSILINKDHIIYVINENEFYINLTGKATSTVSNGGGNNIEIRNLLLFQILWNQNDSFGNILGFNNSGTPFNIGDDKFRQPPYMNVVSNYSYNEYNYSNSPTIFDLSGQRYIFMVNELLTTVDNNSNVRNAFAKLLLPTRAGSYSFNSFITSPKIFINPIAKLSKLEFKFVDYYNNLYQFNGIDHSFSLIITEKLDDKQLKLISSRRLN